MELKTKGAGGGEAGREMIDSNMYLPSIVRILKEDQPLRQLLICSFINLIAPSPFNCNCRVQLIKCECFKLDIDNNFFLREISQIVSY